MGTYIPFTEEQREQARMTDLAAFLRQCGEEVKRSGPENMWLDHGQKVTIRGNLWFHQYEQVGGDAVDFACRFYGQDYREAVLTLTSMGVGVIREPVEPFAKKTLQVPAKYENMRRVYGYLLRRRGIDKEVLDTFAYKGLVYECDRYHKYAKILAKTIINPEGDGTDRGQNAYFYDSAEGLLASVVLLLAEFLPPEETGGYEMRHIASVFKLVQELLMQSSARRGGNQFQELMSLLPADHKAKWLAGSALTASDQGMNSIMSTVLSKLNAFLDTELEQVICFDGSIDAELFVKEKCAIFLILPEEDATKNFVASLMIQNLARELFSVANEHGGRLPNRAVFFAMSWVPCHPLISCPCSPQAGPGG